MYTCKKVLSVAKTLVPAKTEYVNYFHNNSPVTFHFPFGDSCTLQQPERWNTQFTITYSTTLPSYLTFVTGNRNIGYLQYNNQSCH